ncbi:MAG TPA: polysaccharide biosynthesis C-terminal domain-containing protein, partial [Candidatus Krumholzibacteriaceae bacterium]|nr:polysaccharide biosynthesis C-terminal domain-containing protein [Candidatus Krumholzibacteriaceae bacterium]
SIFAPVISEYFGLKQMQKFEQNFKIVTRWILILVLPFFVLILIFNSQIMGIFGDEFILGSMALVILSFGQLINSAVGPSGLVLSMSGNPKYNLLNSSLVLVMNFWLNYWLIPIYGIIGAAIATSTAFVVINLLKLFEVYYLIKVYPYSRNFYKPITAAFISGFMVYYLKKIFLIEDIVPSMFLALLLFILFVSIVFLLKIEPQDKELIYTIQRKFFKKG